MRQVSLKLKSYGNRVNIVDNDNLQRRIFNIMLCSLGVLAFCYVLFMGTMIINIVERKALEANARTLGSEVADLELNYLSLSNKIDASLGTSLGFKEQEVKFATRKSLGKSTGTPVGSVKAVKNEI